jgi:hypothetical protein
MCEHTQVHLGIHDFLLLACQSMSPAPHSNLQTLYNGTDNKISCTREPKLHTRYIADMYNSRRQKCTTLLTHDLPLTLTKCLQTCTIAGSYIIVYLSSGNSKRNSGPDDPYIWTIQFFWDLSFTEYTMQYFTVYDNYGTVHGPRINLI